MLAVYKVDWLEYERGWGVRPDGCSLHATLEEAKTYIQEYWNSMPDRVGGLAPDEYSAPGEPSLIEVTEDQHNMVQQKRNIRLWRFEELDQ